MKLTAKDILALGYKEGAIIGVVLNTIDTHYAKTATTTIKEVLSAVLVQPEAYADHEHLKTIAQKLVQLDAKKQYELLPKTKQYQIYGAEAIEQGAIDQMNIAMRLPISREGALMPDAHQGYGLPIGGVLATENVVIPYGVGVDIGCRMCMSIYDIPSAYIAQNTEMLKKLLINTTMFGKATFKKPKDHAVLSDHLFQEIAFLRDLKDKAYQQIGSSGGGNHFVEFGELEFLDAENEYGLPSGKYLAVLSHSGSRGLGATIAGHYTNIAKQLCPLPDQAKHLAWLDLATEIGQEYWYAMNLAGDYASACHHQIHERIAIGLRANPVARIENHHNFAWKEQDEHGNQRLVHRKGATPAAKGEMGIIPGSMTAPGFIVRGKGEQLAINSASHGAGRLMSRTQAKKTIDPKQVNDLLIAKGVTLIGSGLDEAPMAYKDIHQVMNAQVDLVELVAKFTPKVVRMCGDEKFKEVD